MSDTQDQPLNQRGSSDRRDRSDRRAGSDRRRNAEVRTPIIHLTANALRVLVLTEGPGDQGKLAVGQSMPWRFEAESLHTAQGAQELTVALTKLVGRDKLNGAQAEVLLSSDFCVTRAVTGVADEVQRETAALRERSQLYLSLGPGKKVIASSSIPLDARHAHALLTVTTEQTLHVLRQAIESAGMEVAAIRSAQVCLSRTVQAASDTRDGASLVVSVDDDRVELGVMSGGRLFLDYRPGGDTHVEQLGELLRQHHTRLRRYCQRQHGLEGEELARVVVSGTAKETAVAAANVAQVPQLRPQVLDLGKLELPWQQAGDALTPDMAAVVGAALGMGDPVTDRGPNLVDQLVSNSRPAIGKLLARKLAPLAAALLLVAVFGVLAWNARREVADLQSQLSLLAPKAARAAKLQVELRDGLREMQELEELEQQLTDPPHALLLRNLTQSIPADVWLSGVRISGAEVATLAGASYSETSIYDLVSHLQHLPGVAQVALQGTGVGRTGHQNATTFDIHLDLDLTGEAAEQSGEESL